MGLRGPLPALVTAPAEPLADLTPPDWLGPDGKAYWDRHKDYLTANGLLTRATADSFAILCDSWQRLCDLRREATSRLFLDLQKAYSRDAKLFRLMPCDRPGAPLAGGRHANKGEFTLED